MSRTPKSPPLAARGREADLPQAHRLTDEQIAEFGLEEAPEDAGPSWEEIAAMRAAWRRPDGRR